MLDPRLIRVGIEVDGEVRIYDERMDLTVRGAKMANAQQNTCEVTITNLARDTRNYILTETSPFNRNRTPKRLFVEVGRVSQGVQRIFQGEVVESAPTQPPDIGLTLKAQTGAFAKGNIVATSAAPLEALSAIAARVAAALGVSLDFQATDKQIANYAFTGPALRQVDALGLAGGVDAYVDDDVLVVKNRTTPLAARVKVLSADSGLVGVPEATERGVKCTFMLDAQTALGGSLDLVSALNPALTGRYTIYELEFEAQSRGPAFYWTAGAEREAA